jgi:SAM-dependent methyltransferase
MTRTDSEYQRDLSLSSPILLDRDYKRPKVDKMLAVLEAAGAICDTPRGQAVDVGCSRGFFADGIAPHFDTVVGVDIDPHALRLAESERRHGNLLFVAGDSQHLPLADASVDLVICNHVYEHVPSAETLMAEIHRVLRPGGICYLGAASRLIIVEPHYHLPFLSWLPKPLAHRYMRLFHRGDYYYEKLRTYPALRRLISGFRVEDYTIAVLREPGRFMARDMIPQGSLIERVPAWLWKLLYPLLPTYILILRKS